LILNDRSSNRNITLFASGPPVCDVLQNHALSPKSSLKLLLLVNKFALPCTPGKAVNPLSFVAPRDAAFSAEQEQG